MESYRRFRAWLEKNRDLGFELVRIYLGLGLFVKGIYFSTHVSQVLDLMGAHGSMDVGNVIIAHYVAMAHLAGGLLVACGFLTRIAAAAQVPVLIGAVVGVHFNEGLFQRSQNLEFAVLVLFLLVITAFHGGGRLSADARVFGTIKEQRRQEHQTEAAAGAKV